MGKPAPLGNKYAVGARGGRRPSPKEEREHLWAWRGRKEMTKEEAKLLALEVLADLGDGQVEVDYRTDVVEIAQRLKATGKCSGWEAFLLEAIGKRNPALLGKWADKVLADLHDLRGKDGAALKLEGFIYSPPKGEEMN